MKHYILALICLLITACGFHLRDSIAFAPEDNAMYLDALNVPNDSVNTLRRSLKGAGIHFVPLNDASLILKITKLEFQQQLINISGNTQVRNYQLNYILQFQVLDQSGMTLLIPKEINIVSMYASNDNQLLGDADVLAYKRQSMQNAAVAQLIERLNVLAKQRHSLHAT